MTIGDGLASQVPSLLMSISAGIVMTRSSAASSSLGLDLAAQVLSKPYSLFFACCFLMLIVLTSSFTGLPWLPFLFFTDNSCCSDFLYLLIRMSSPARPTGKRTPEYAGSCNPNKMYERLGVGVLALQVGSGLLPIADPEQEGQLLAKSQPCASA